MYEISGKDDAFAYIQRVANKWRLPIQLIHPEDKNIAY
ncbi:hypothetical protein Hneap_1098 [Halothiobacillus neapolitanus c2]|uniref:Uncharacterized protein n=1 Tax=Halothiobacillus neapolitanus (strain ATCC 23641 / DSM 15147 / CIP 104769 / NCIMB 8539 / c2) TaxID=555778 RepID=D0KZR1_HALNC|nr:hypothetical protein Hneap_1098 [Halothiobacillus neapolitanus c2]